MISDTEITLNNFLKQNNYSLPVLEDVGGSISSTWGITSVPTTFFIDADGIIRKVQVGTFDNAKQIEDILNSF